jgi:hypothetical protein
MFIPPAITEKKINNLSLSLMDWIIPTNKTGKKSKILNMYELDMST